MTNQRLINVPGKRKANVRESLQQPYISVDVTLLKRLHVVFNQRQKNDQKTFYKR